MPTLPPMPAKPSMPSMPSMPSRPAMPSLSSLADLPDVPGPVLALVGVGDVATQAARDLQAKFINVDTGDLNLRDKEVRIDLSSIDFGKLDPRNLSHTKIDLAKIDPRNIDAATLTATGLLWAAKGQEAYESLVARGEIVVTKARSSEWSEAVADEAPVVAKPPAAKKAAAKPAKKATAPKADPQD